MYRELLTTNWEQILNKDIVMKTNTVRRIITVKGSEFIPNDESIIIVYYNLATGTPYLLVQVYTKEIPGLDVPDIEGFEGSYFYENGTTEIMYVDSVIKSLST